MSDSATLQCTRNTSPGQLNIVTLTTTRKGSSMTITEMLSSTQLTLIALCVYSALLTLHSILMDYQILVLSRTLDRLLITQGQRLYVQGQEYPHLSAYQQRKAQDG